MVDLEPNWNRAKPTREEAWKMCSEVALSLVRIQADPITQVLNRLRDSHSNGGAFLNAVLVGHSEVFDWFASRNRLLEFEILPRLLRRNEIRDSLPELRIQADYVSDHETDGCSFASSGGFKFDNPFLLDGQLAQSLFAGGAYPPSTKIEGKTAKRLAMEFCEVIFDQRYEDVSLYSSYEAWTPWFAGIAWDWTAVLFDKRTRTLWILAVTDED
ncbi:hypothetical protein DYQ86_01005 [Acidobacteria bacterium AB60]|nr:hypothetical protein DYQ86_01005 [Acidobacteria bacterium AB60]